MQTNQSTTNASAAETAQDIECIGEAPASVSDKTPRPLYRAFGYSGKWSGPHLPPKPGSRVKINFNGLGTGEVVNYFSESGWLGIRVKLDKEPDWRKKQATAGKLAMIFGAEFSPI
jgi:hypothetical protein